MLVWKTVAMGQGAEGDNNKDSLGKRSFDMTRLVAHCQVADPGGAEDMSQIYRRIFHVVLDRNSRSIRI